MRTAISMSDRKITYPTAFSCWEDEEHDAMARVRSSGRYTMGPEVEAFEHEFAAYHARKHGIMVNSGSSANLIAVAALHEKIQEPLRRPEIAWLEKSNGISEPYVRHPETAVVPAIAWSTTYAPLVQHGMNLHVADVDDTWNAPVPTWLPHANTRLVVACSILGNPSYLDAWQKAADRLGAYLIEDNCESLGAVDGDGLRCGTAGIMSTFSFFHSHQISAIEGGMILTDDDELDRVCRELRAHGWTRDTLQPEGFDREYNFIRMGYNARPLELHAAVAREQLRKLPNFIAARLENWRLFAKLAADLPIELPRVNGTLSPFGLPFTLNEEEKRETLALALRTDGVDCRLPTGGSFRLHPYAATWARQKTPNADRIHRAGMFLGNGPWNIRDDITRAVEIMRRVLG
jgi:CDP-6-deoxy-D-xylo-4-hexulose-3-dehydrase